MLRFDMRAFGIHRTTAGTAAVGQRRLLAQLVRTHESFTALYPMSSCRGICRARSR